MGGSSGRRLAALGMNPRDPCTVALAASVNVATWSNISRWVTGRAWVGASAAIVAMLAAERAGAVSRLPPLLRIPVGVLTVPGSVAVGVLSVQSSLDRMTTGACCDACAEGKACATGA